MTYEKEKQAIALLACAAMRNSIEVPSMADAMTNAVVLLTPLPNYLAEVEAERDKYKAELQHIAEHCKSQPDHSDDDVMGWTRAGAEEALRNG